MNLNNTKQVGKDRLKLVEGDMTLFQQKDWQGWLQELKKVP